MKNPTRVPFVPHKWSDSDAIIGQLMEVIEAVMPVSEQQDATKRLIKKVVQKHFESSYERAYAMLSGDEDAPWFTNVRPYQVALHELDLKLNPDTK